MQALGFLLTWAATVFAATVTYAQDWPARPVRWVLSQPAGSSPDVVARHVAEYMARAWGKPIVIENRPGGQNIIGAQLAARTTPDGYAFYYGTTAAIVTNAFTFKSLPYDPQKDFVAVGIVGKSPFIIAAGTAASVRSLADLISQAKSQPEKLSIATEGARTFSGMLAEMLQSVAGARLNNVPYARIGDAVQDTLGGRTQLICLSSAALMPLIAAGRMHPLAVSSARRVPGLPHVPALAESFPGFEYTGWHGLFARTGTPGAVVERANRDLDRALRDAEVAERLAVLGLINEGAGTPQSAAAFVLAERERWASIVKRIGLVPE